VAAAEKIPRVRAVAVNFMLPSLHDHPSRPE
jgi:hypothetical protein